MGGIAYQSESQGDQNAQPTKSNVAAIYTLYIETGGGRLIMITPGKVTS
jgi:hypothetical protein